MSTKQKLYTVIDEYFVGDNEYHMNEKDLRDFTKVELEYTDYPNTNLKSINDVIEFLVVFDFTVENITHPRELKNRKILVDDVDDWLKIYNQSENN